MQLRMVPWLIVERYLSSILIFLNNGSHYRCCPIIMQIHKWFLWDFIPLRLLNAVELYLLIREGANSELVLVFIPLEPLTLHDLLERAERECIIGLCFIDEGEFDGRNYFDGGICILHTGVGARENVLDLVF
jgi:hypothetical protein